MYTDKVDDMLRLQVVHYKQMVSGDLVIEIDLVVGSRRARPFARRKIPLMSSSSCAPNSNSHRTHYTSDLSRDRVCFSCMQTWQGGKPLAGSDPKASAVHAQ
jgi:hypothetical protein